MLHQPRVALLLHLLRHLARKGVGRGAVDILIFEAADAGEPRLAQPIEQEGEVLLGLAGKADDEGRADGEVRANRRASARMRSSVFS